MKLPSQPKMNDAKNIFIAWFSAGSPLLAAAASETGVTLLSAVVLPVLFFAIGKTIDVLLQIYLAGKNTSSSECAPSSSSVVGPNSAWEDSTTEKEEQERSDNR